MHQNIYHLYLILEKLAQKMEKKTKIHSSKSQSLQYQIFSDLSNPDLRILDLISFPDPMKIWDLILIPIPKNGTQIPIFLDPDPKEQFIGFKCSVKTLVHRVLYQCILPQCGFLNSADLENIHSSHSTQYKILNSAFWQYFYSMIPIVRISNSAGI